MRLALARHALTACARASCAALLLLASLAHADIPIRAEWLPGASGLEAGQVLAGDFDAAFQAFDPTRLSRFPRDPHGVWIRLHPQSGLWPDQPLAVVVRHPSLERVTLHAGERPVLSLQALSAVPAALEPGYGRLHFPLHWDDADGKSVSASLERMDRNQPILLRVESQPVRPAAITLAVVPHGEFVQENGRWLAFASACFAIMVAMAVVALFFASILRDITFVYYAGYVLCFCLILSLQSGFLMHPLGWEGAWDWFRPLGRAATATSILLAVLFLDRFATLRRYSPRGRWLALGLGASVVGLMLLGSLPWAPLQVLPSLLINPLLALGAPLVLGVALNALRRGSLYAGVFLLGWAPLLLLTMLDSAGLPALAGLTWLGDGMLAAGAFEALVLSLGLAGRALSLRHERDLARMLADTDPLTALLNRRAWDSRLDTMLTRARGGRQSLSVVFLDLDHFKRLNDSQGHEAGDAALRRLAQLIHAEVLPDGLAGRYGGEEFVVALPGRRAAEAHAVAERIRSALRQSVIPADDQGATLDVSIGVAELQRGDTAANLVHRADQAMYADKHRRRGTRG